MNDKVNIRNIEKFSKALGDPHRIRIMELVKKDEWIECEEIISVVKLSQSTISHHLKQLVDANLLIAEKVGRNCKYQINRDFIGAISEYLNSFCVTVDLKAER